MQLSAVWMQFSVEQAWKRQCVKTVDHQAVWKQWMEQSLLPLIGLQSRSHTLGAQLKKIGSVRSRRKRNSVEQWKKSVGEEAVEELSAPCSEQGNRPNARSAVWT